MTVTISRAMNDNLTIVNTKSATLYFSYETLVAFSTPESETVVHDNIWSQTTNRHLNYIDGGSKEAKAQRVDSVTFAAKLKEAGLV